MTYPPVPDEVPHTATLIHEPSIVEEFIFVFASIRFPRVSGSAFRLSVLSAALLPFLGFASNASAQAAPQLLPTTLKTIAGGGATAPPYTACPTSGYTLVDNVGDGCLATDIQVGAPRYAVADQAGNVFFSDYTNSLIRRIDATTGVVTAVAGNVTLSSSPSGACGTYTATDILGDGCLGTAVKLLKPTGLAFSSTGDLYFSESDYATSLSTGGGHVRKIAATSGLIPASGGVVSLVLGQPAAGAKGYAANPTTCTPTSVLTCITPATSYLFYPYGLVFDAAGNLYVQEEYKEATLVYNPTAAATTVTNVVIPAGTVGKVIGAYGTSAPFNQNCPNAPASPNGCSYNLTTFGGQASLAEIDSTYSIALDSSGNLYYGNEYYDYVGKVSTAGIISQFAGIQNSVGAKPTLAKRGAAGTFGVGSIFGIAGDTLGNVYFSDASSGVIWRVDASGTQYVTATGLGSSGTGNYATAASPGVFGVSVDAYNDLFAGDTVKNLVTEVSNGTQFGNTGASQTDTVTIHFGAGDSPASSGAYTITAGSSIFTVGTCTPVPNIDNNPSVGNTTDCALPITANPTAAGPYTGTLVVKSAMGKTSTFVLNGNFVQSPITHTVLTVSDPAVTSCGTTSTYATTDPLTLKAVLAANGPTPPASTDKIIFYSNGVALAPVTGVAVSNLGTTAAPVYGATLSYTFSTAGNYALTAQYVPTAGSYYLTSTSSTVNIVSNTPVLSAVALSTQQSTIAPGGTALYSFNVATTLYTGTINFSCSGLPANSTCVFSPASITGTGCNVTSTVALNIYTQAPTTSMPAGFGGNGSGPWRMVGVFAGLVLAALIGAFRRRIPLRSGQLLMAIALLLAASGLTACSKATGTVLSPGTPAFNNNVTVTATGSDGTISSFTVPLNVL